ncbi:unnamed protein product [Ambrosiozyma monospora]|uniref:Unnamed protein product n=1 Tax=Ambrosiozyma monospora TaxID=43982 RepID=A0ACB5TXL6_AMBMO|nr:unnamed protein product [Ambrosiozyma monospora]
MSRYLWKTNPKCEYDHHFDLFSKLKVSLVPIDGSSDIPVDSSPDVPVDSFQDLLVDSSPVLPADSSSQLPEDTSSDLAADSFSNHSVDSSPDLTVDTFPDLPVDTSPLLPVDISPDFPTDIQDLQENSSPDLPADNPPDLQADGHPDLQEDSSSHLSEDNHSDTFSFSFYFPKSQILPSSTDLFCRWYQPYQNSDDDKAFRYCTDTLTITYKIMFEVVVDIGSLQNSTSTQNKQGMSSDKGKLSRLFFVIWSFKISIDNFYHDSLFHKLVGLGGYYFCAVRISMLKKQDIIFPEERKVHVFRPF